MFKRFFVFFIFTSCHPHWGNAEQPSANHHTDTNNVPIQLRTKNKRRKKVDANQAFLYLLGSGALCWASKTGYTYYNSAHSSSQNTSSTPNSTPVPSGPAAQPALSSSLPQDLIVRPASAINLPPSPSAPQNNISAQTPTTISPPPQRIEAKKSLLHLPPPLNIPPPIKPHVAAAAQPPVTHLPQLWASMGRDILTSLVSSDKEEDDEENDEEEEEHAENNNVQPHNASSLSTIDPPNKELKKAFLARQERQQEKKLASQSLVAPSSSVPASVPTDTKQPIKNGTHKLDMEKIDAQIKELESLYDSTHQRNSIIQSLLSAWKKDNNLIYLKKILKVDPDYLVTAVVERNALLVDGLIELQADHSLVPQGSIKSMYNLLKQASVEKDKKFIPLLQKTLQEYQQSSPKNIEPVRTLVRAHPSCIHTAIRTQAPLESPELLEILIKAKADVNYRQVGKTPLDVAVMEEHYNCIQPLLAAEAKMGRQEWTHPIIWLLDNIHFKNKKNIVAENTKSFISIFTPKDLNNIDEKGGYRYLMPGAPPGTFLHYAVRKNAPSIVANLKLWNADLTLCDSEGQTPKDLAVSLNRKSCIKALEGTT